MTIKPEDFDKLDLPKSTANEDLESLSRNRLGKLFRTDLFELRDEVQRDKGVDITAELKRKSRYTNFRFAIQLKATASTKYNIDQSISFPIEISNINYLLNSSTQAYYILYEKRRDKFFYETAHEVHRMLIEKYSESEFPTTFSVRFHKRLNLTELKKIHEKAFRTGLLIRSLTPLLQVNLQKNNLDSSVVIDKNQNIYTKEEKVQHIENFGFSMLNQLKFKELIEMEEQCYPLTAPSPKFSFICGMAYYHRSLMYKAMVHFKGANAGKDELNPKLQGMLLYYSQMAQYSLGIINADKIKSTVKDLKNDDYLGLHLQIEKAFDTFAQAEGDENDNLKIYYDKLKAVKTNPICDESMGMMANSYILLMNGYDVTSKTSQLLYKERMFGFNIPEYQKAYLQLTDWFDNRAQELCQMALDQGNDLTYYIICINIIRSKFNYIVTTNIIRHYDEATETAEYTLSEEDVTYLEKQIEFLNNLADVYEQESFIENATVALSIKYELLHLLKRPTEASSTAEKMKDLIESNDLNSLRTSYEALVDGGTTHQKLFRQIKAHFATIRSTVTEVKDLQQKIKDIDIQDSSLAKEAVSESHEIQLFPLGIFSFPKSGLSVMLNLINATEQIKIQLKNMLELGASPIVDITKTTVETEGPVDVSKNPPNVESLRNLYRIRQGLFKNKIYRTDSLRGRPI